MLAIVPFLNQQQQNSFSNTALAQGYDKYRDSSYSQYPTDDKKYECRTGPFKGFFVASVKFCKFKFDDKDRRVNNQTGTQGPPGPQGAMGPQGIQGAPRSTGATGATGPQGERGLTEATGATGTPGEDRMDGVQGPSGLSTINGTNLYSVIGNVSTNIPGGPYYQSLHVTLGDCEGSSSSQRYCRW
jgi:hypothetical protein